MPGEFFDLDKNQLDEEWVRQPGLYHEYALKLADARQAWEEAKAHRDVAEAEISLMIREAPSKFGLEKLTEDIVKKATVTQNGMVKAEEEVIAARHELDVAEAACTALDHRKKALENLVQLRLSDYFAEPRAPKGATDRLADASRKTAFRKAGRAMNED